MRFCCSTHAGETLYDLARHPTPLRAVQYETDVGSEKQSYHLRNTKYRLGRWGNSPITANEFKTRSNTPTTAKKTTTENSAVFQIGLDFQLISTSAKPSTKAPCATYVSAGFFVLYVWRGDIIRANLHLLSVIYESSSFCNSKRTERNCLQNHRKPFWVPAGSYVA